MPRSDLPVGRASDQDAATISSSVRDVASSMLDQLPSLAAAVTTRVLAEVPGLDTPEVTELVATMSEANGALVLNALMRDVSVADVVATADFVRGTQALAHHRIPLPAVLRAYRVGHAQWWNFWAEQVGRHVDLEHSAAVVAAGSRSLFAWVDLLSDQATTTYLEEASRLARQASVAQAAFVRDILNADPDDLAAAGRRLGYDLGARHLAVVLKVPPGEEMTEGLLEQTARTLSAACGPGRHLAVPIDSRTAWIWVVAGVDAQVPTNVSKKGRAGIGRPGRGLSGFRSSHGEALEASRIAELAKRPPGSVTSYANVELAALCTHDVEACRRFVRSTLGPLAVADDQSRRLLATLRLFFREGSNYRATARQLGVHHNTVVYRVGQAEELLGHPLNEHRVELEIALTLAQTLGDRILTI